ncbi:TlpA family protein disulfide reductase [Chitinophaga sp. NPDC101104]|uniref:TlpA family protein disulfide reductase n=1 Tax=Chitinophaga sp. NPDC101104 TaxID=3390561 RepID=UPI003D012D45
MRFTTTPKNIVKTLIFICLSACNCVQAQVIISGKLTGFEKNEIVQLFDIENDRLINSSQFVDNVFKMELPKLVAKKYLLTFKKAQIGKIIWLENGKTSIYGGKENVVNDPLKDSKLFLHGIRFSGAPTQLEEDNFYQRISTDLHRLDTLQHPFEYIYSIQPKFTDFESIPRKTDSLRDIIKQKKIAYVKTHPRSTFATYLFLELLKDNVLSGSEASAMYSKVKPASFYGNILQDIFKHEYYPLVNGSRCADFSLPDESNVPTRFSAHLNNVTLLTFWATSCPAAVEELKVLRSIYQEYNKQGLSVFAVSIDGNKDKWKQKIRDEGHPWINTNARNDFLSTVSLRYGVKSLPRTFLIDKKGNIIDADVKLDFPETIEKIKALLSEAAE